MGTIRTYRHHCPTCNEETGHVLARSLSFRIVRRTWILLVFFVTMGLVYPHPLPSDDDPVEVRCTKCLTGGTMIGG